MPVARQRATQPPYASHHWGVSGAGSGGGVASRGRRRREAHHGRGLGMWGHMRRWWNRQDPLTRRDAAMGTVVGAVIATSFWSMLEGLSAGTIGRGLAMGLAYGAARLCSGWWGRPRQGCRSRIVRASGAPGGPHRGADTPRRPRGLWERLRRALGRP